jgi:hypothetical protein
LQAELHAVFLGSLIGSGPDRFPQVEPEHVEFTQAFLMIRGTSLASSAACRKSYVGKILKV